jgi:nitrate reductase gamma subunit
VNTALFGVFPYIAIALGVGGTVERLLRHPSTVTSRSSQFLESRQHFWALVPFHFGILIVIAGHVTAVAIPHALAGWNASLPRLFALEIFALASGMLAAGGLALGLFRRLSTASVRATTSGMDWLVLGVLLLQLLGGIGVAVTQTWGSGWFTAVAAPYLWSIVWLQPDLSAVAALPAAIKAHIAGAWLLIAIFPFTRLVHALKPPIGYLWRRPQIVRWYKARA